MFGSVYCMFRLNHDFGMTVLCAAPFIIGCLCFCMWKANPLFDRLQSQLDEMNTIRQEDISGIRIIKACVRELHEKKRFGQANDSLIRTQLRVLVIFAFMNPAVNTMMYLCVAVILRVGNVDVAAGSTTPGSIMAAITYTTQLLNGILMLVMLIQTISRGIASWRRVREILESTPEIRNGSSERKPAGHGSVEFKDVSFTYSGSSRPVLRHVNLQIAPGETVAIMGATGCGKSTLISLIPRFFDTGDGTVLVDGVDVRDYSIDDLRGRVTTVLQKAELFTGTIRDNIRMGNPSAGEEEIQKAAQASQAEEFIRTQPEGMDTLVAERGASLSGGQKQRVSIARSLVRPSEIRIFDDSTSALDLRTEAELYRALQSEYMDSTKIFVTQRVATARRADRIIVLENGTVAGNGTHDGLMASCPAYREIYLSQMGGEADDELGGK